MGKKYRRRYKNTPVGLLIILGLMVYSYLARTIGINNIIVIVFLIIVLIAGMALYSRYQTRMRYLQSGIREIDRMSGEQFEQCLKHHFQKMGYKAETTAKTHDFGADLIMWKEGEKIIVQAKRYADKIGIKAVQEVIGAMVYYSAGRGYVVSNSYFTSSARELAKKSNVELWDRSTIINTFYLKDEIEESVIKDSNTYEAPVPTLTNTDNICPRCGKELVIRNGSRGKFYGCTGFPACRYTKDL